MENQYIKQYPELMKGKKIMYNHGFGSAASSGTVKFIKQTFPNAEVVAYDIPLHPAEAMTMLREKAEQEKPDLIIGTSMGAMYTEMLYGYDRILVNPAFDMAQTMKDYGLTGKQTWQNPRKDGETEFLVTKALEKEYKEMNEQNFAVLEAMSETDKAKEKGRVWGLFGDEDNYAADWDSFTNHYQQAAFFHGGHRLDDNTFLRGIVPVIRWIDDKQEERERQIVFIDSSCLTENSETSEDVWNNEPKPSLQKAFEYLIEQYQVYIVVPSPTNDHDSYSKSASWIEKYLSTPAHDRVVYTNQKQLLYGDFYIDMHPVDGMLSTTIQLGSDEFKTWEEVITYFSRLHE